MNKNRNNYYKIDTNLYLVTTQAGFEKVQRILSYEGHNNVYPKYYPSVVSSYERYVGYNKTMFVCTPLNDYIKKQQEVISRLFEIDKEHNAK